MKKPLMFSLVAVLALGVAGITWAAYPTADAPVQPAAAATLETHAGAQGPSLDQLTQENEELTAGLDALFDEPMETADACCWANCRAEKWACEQACGGFGNEGCILQCWDEFDICTSSC